MSTTSRKARKRAGIPFTRTPKTVTPPQERAVRIVQEPNQSVHPSRRAIRRLEWLFDTVTYRPGRSADQSGETKELR